MNSPAPSSVVQRLADAYTADGDSLWSDSIKMLDAITEMKEPLDLKRQDMQGILDVDALFEQATRVADGLLYRRGY